MVHRAMSRDLQRRGSANGSSRSKSQLNRSVSSREIGCCVARCLRCAPSQMAPYGRWAGVSPDWKARPDTGNGPPEFDGRLCRRSECRGSAMSFKAVKAKQPAIDAKVCEAFGLLLETGTITELRALGTKQGIVSGYFSDYGAMTNAAAGLSGKVEG